MKPITSATVGGVSAFVLIAATAGVAAGIIFGLIVFGGILAVKRIMANRRQAAIDDQSSDDYTGIGASPASQMVGTPDEEKLAGYDQSTRSSSRDYETPREMYSRPGTTSRPSTSTGSSTSSSASRKKSDDDSSSSYASGFGTGFGVGSISSSDSSSYSSSDSGSSSSSSDSSSVSGGGGDFGGGGSSDSF